MKEKISWLQERWESFKLSEKGRVFSALEFSYDTKYLRGKREKIVEALVFWKFATEELNILTIKERRVFLSLFTGDNNHLLGVVAMVESFPTIMWRKILWSYNIDFSSCESFLRRLTVTEVMVIQDNYLDLFRENKVPRVFTMFDKKFRGVTVEKLLSESSYGDFEKRYASKGAMSYDLLGLNFGFNAFPKGIRDDTKKIEASPMQFLSVKNHADDFVVNTEDGKYWWLYRTVRSNYVWKPNRDVKLKTHICPGFWYTLLMHLLFWIISPAIAAVLVTILASGYGHSVSKLLLAGLAIPGIFTPLWLTAAIVKLSFNKVLTENVKKKMSDFGERHDKAIIIAVVIAGILFVSAVVIVVAIAIYLIAKPLGVFWASVTVILCFTFLFLILGKKNNEDYFRAHPEMAVFLKIILPTFTGGLLIRIALHYQKLLLKIALWIVDFLGSLVNLIVSVISLLGLASLVFVSPFLFFALMVFLSKNLTDKQMEKFCIVIEKAMPYIVGLVLTASFAVLLINMDKTVPPMVMVTLSIMYLVSGILLGIFATQAYDKYDPRFISNAEVLRKVCEYGFGRKMIKTRWIVKNKWLQSLGKEERELQIWKLVKIFDAIFSWIDLETAYLEFVPIMTAEALDNISVYESSLKYLREGKSKIIRLMIAGHTFGRAREIYHQERQKAERVRKGFLKTLKIIFFPVVLSYLALKKLSEYSKTLYKLWKLFNQLCPYVTQSKILKIGE